MNKEDTSDVWWTLEFSSDVQVDWIKIWNRMDNGGNFEYRIDNVKVRQKKLMAQFKPVETSNTLIINII